METVSEGRKYLEPNRCEAPNSVPKKESEHPFRERVFKHLPLLTNVVTVLTVLGGTGCAEVFAHRPLPGETVVVPNTGGGNPKPEVIIMPPTVTKEPTLVPIGGPEDEHPPLGYSLNKEGKYIFVNDKGEKIIAPSLVGLTPELHTARGENVLAYYTGTDNPYGLKTNIPVGLFSPNGYIPENTPNAAIKTWKIILTPEVLAYLNSQGHLPDAGLFTSASFDIKSYIDDQGLSPYPNMNRIIQQEKNPIDPALLESTIRNITIYGSEKPIDKEALPEFIKKINEEKNKMLDDTYYESIFVPEEVYKQFPVDNYGESMESFLARHTLKLEEIIVKGGGHSKVTLRRIVILKEKSDLASIYTNIDKLEDSDGFWYFDSDYIAHEGNYYSYVDNLEHAFIHELAHSATRLPDTYPLNLDKNNLVLPENAPIFLGVSEEWRSYAATSNPHLNDVMANPDADHFYMSEYMTLQLERRLKNHTVHTKATKEEGSWQFPNEIPETSILDFGKQFAGAKIEIYGSTEYKPETRKSFYERKITFYNLLEDTVSENGSFTTQRDQLFPPKTVPLVPAEQSNFFIKVTTKDNQVFFRHFDITYENMAYWKGFTDKVVMKMNLATNGDDPKTFQSEIEYSNP